MLDQQIEGIQQGTTKVLNVLWGRIKSVSFTRSDTAPGIYTGLVESLTITLEDGVEVVYDDPIVATTAYRYIEERFREEGCVTAKPWE